MEQMGQVLGELAARQVAPKEGTNKNLRMTKISPMAATPSRF